MKRKTGIIITIATTVAVAAATAMAWHSSRREAQPDGRALLAKGVEEVNKNNVAQAFSHLQQATTALREQNDTDGLFEAAVYTAVLYDQIGRRDSAYAILRRTAFRDVPNYKDYASQYYLRMMGHYKAAIDRDYAAAESFTQRAIEFSREKYPGDAMYMYVDMANLAETYITAGQPGKARRLLDSLQRMGKADHQLYMSEVCYCRGLLAMADGDTDSAARHLEASVAFSRKYNAFDNEMASLNLLAKIDSANNDLPGYIAHRTAYDSLRERVKGKEIHYKIEMLREQHKVDMLRQESARRSTVLQLAMCIMLLVILAMLAAIIYIYKSSKTKQKLGRLERQRLDDAVERERLEKELLQLKMKQQGEMLDHTYKENIVMGMKLAEQGAGSESVKPMERALKEMDKDFIHKVETLFPTLSRNDIRLMSLIRMELPSGEISKILNITMDSLHKSRYRLRKKLGLGGGQSLEAFINSI